MSWRRRCAMAICVVVATLIGCGGDRFTPRLTPAPKRWDVSSSFPDRSAVARWQGFAQQFEENRALPVERLRHVVVLVMTPAYGFVEQVRRGNMGHAAIEVEGRLYDMGALNGYAYTLRPTPAVRFWNFPDAETALAAVRGHADCDGHLDRIVRFDVIVTDAQAAALRQWWEQMERRMLADPQNRLYIWSQWQCASSVSASLRDGGVAFLTVGSPSELADYLRDNLRHTAGRAAGKRAEMTVVQKGRRPRRGPRAVQDAATLLFRWPAMFEAGRRTRVTIESPDGGMERVLWSGSDEYRRVVVGFAVKPQDAVKLAFEGKPAWGAQSVPNFVVGRWYHVASDHVIGQASIGGVYVNGDSGAVVRRDDRRVIRFDLFGGDHVVNCNDGNPASQASRG